MKYIRLFSIFLAFALSTFPAPGGSVAGAGEEAAAQPQQQSVSPAQAFAMVSQEVANGNAAALVTLGGMYERGVGTPRDFAKAFDCFSRAAAAGLPEGYYNTGVCYEIGMGTTGSANPENVQLAFRNFEKAAELGLSQGLYKLAGMYIAGASAEKNEAWGVELLGRAAAAGHAGAGNDLGVIYFEGSFAQKKDTVKAYEWFAKSAELGNGEAMKNLAVFYRDGIDRKPDVGQELKWYALARLAGYPAEPLNAAIEEVKKKMSVEDVARIETEAQAWVKAFQERRQATVSDATRAQ